MRFLEPRQRSISEVRTRLTGAGYQPLLVEEMITRLIELGMLDDLAFARAWVESRDRANPRGAHVLRNELVRKGIERATVVEVLEERADQSVAGAASADEAAALRLLSRHASALARVEDPHKRRQRAYALLARSGFDADTCRALAAIVTAVAESED